MQNSSVYALITGSTRGIGRAIAFQLAQEGIHLLLTSRHAQDLDEMSSFIKQQFPHIQVHQAAFDLCKASETEALAQWALHFHPEILINNAAVFQPITFFDQAEEDQRAQWQVNFFAALTLSKVLGNDMKRRKKGHIVMIGSTASRESVQAATYTVTKVALHGLTNVLRDELRAHEVRVTEIVPGSTWTSSWEGTSLPENVFMQASDIAEAVLYAIKAPRSAMVEEIVIRPPKGNVTSF